MKGAAGGVPLIHATKLLQDDRDTLRPAPGNRGVKELSGAHRLRCYRDPCGDYHISGKYGEIFSHGPGRLGVQVGGPRANRTETAITPAGANRVIARLRREGRWPISQAGGRQGPAQPHAPQATTRRRARLLLGVVPSCRGVHGGRRVGGISAYRRSLELLDPETSAAVRSAIVRCLEERTLP